MRIWPRIMCFDRTACILAPCCSGLVRSVLACITSNSRTDKLCKAIFLLPAWLTLTAHNDTAAEACD